MYKIKWITNCVESHNIYNIMQYIAGHPAVDSSLCMPTQTLSDLQQCK